MFKVSVASKRDRASKPIFYELGCYGNAGADPGGVPRKPLHFVNVLLATICVFMYMYQLFSFDYTGTPPPVEIAGSAAVMLHWTIPGLKHAHNSVLIRC